MDRSYAVMMWFPFVDASEDGDGVTAAVNVVQGTSTTGWSPTQVEPSPAVTGMSGSHRTIIVSATDCSGADACTFDLQATVTSLEATSQTFYLVVAETTLHSPYWAVSSAAGYDAAPRIKSNGPTAVRVLLIHRDATGAEVCRYSGTLGGGGMRGGRALFRCSLLQPPGADRPWAKSGVCLILRRDAGKSRRLSPRPRT